MKTKLELIGTVLVFLLVSLPVSAQVVKPGNAEEKSVRDVIEDLDKVTNAHQIMGPELKHLEDEDTNVALFVATDKSLKKEDVANMSEEEKEAFVERHMSTGLASEEPIEYIEWFVTEDGKKTRVFKKNDDVVLDDSTSIVEAIPAKNGIVYIIDESLAS